MHHDRLLQAATAPKGAAAAPCSEPAAGHGGGGEGGDGRKVSGVFRFLRGGADRTPRPPRGGSALRRGRSRSPGNAPCPRPVPLRSAPLRRLRHVRPQPRGAPALPGAHLLPRLRAAAAASPPVPDRQPDLRQQGPHGTRAAELLPLHAAQVFGSPGQGWHVQEQQPEHGAGDEPLHRPRHLHHRLRAPGFPPQLQPQRPLALRGPAALARTPLPLLSGLGKTPAASLGTEWTH